MGRHKQPKIPGAIDWQPKINDIQEEDKTLIYVVAARQRRPVGDLIREWAVSGAKREAKRLRLIMG